VIGGEEKLETVQVEDKVKFKLDISKVYWCSKLSTERTRMIDTFFKEGDVLLDMFCGIGPLAVKAAVKKKLRVLANDLNPACYEYLLENIKLNKVGELVQPFNMDAREFARMAIREPHSLKFKRFDHAYMNLPMDAIEFLDVFIGLFRDADKEIWGDPFQLPLIHVYGFTHEATQEEALNAFVVRMRKAMRFPGFSKSDILNFHQIRDVSNTSRMYSTSFKLPEEVAFAEGAKELEEEIKGSGGKR